MPGNMWQEAWEGAKPIPAKRQKRLFNDTKEAEKVRVRLIINSIAARQHKLVFFIIIYIFSASKARSVL